MLVKIFFQRIKGSPSIDQFDGNDFNMICMVVMYFKTESGGFSITVRITLESFEGVAC